MPGLFGFFKTLPELELDETKKRIFFIYVVALLCIIVVYFYFILRPTLKRLFDLMPRVQERRLEINTVKNDLLYEDNFKKRLQTLHQTMDKYEKRLSREKELPLLLENLSEIAKSSRVKILSITPIDRGPPGKGEEERVYQEVPIAISAQSSYHELGTFINRLENAQRYMQVSNVKIMSNRDNPRRHRVEFVVYAYTFRKE